MIFDDGKRETTEETTRYINPSILHRASNLIPRYPTYPTLPHISHTIPRWNTTPASTVPIIPAPQDYSLRHASGFGRCPFGAFAVHGNYSHFAVHTM